MDEAPDFPVAQVLRDQQDLLMNRDERQRRGLVESWQNMEKIKVDYSVYPFQ